MKRAFALLAAMALTACSAPVQMDKATTAVTEFYQKQAAGDDEGIYNDAAPELRNSASLAQWKRLDDAVRAAVARGCAAPPTSATTWNVYYGTGGSRITLVYNRSCADGDLSEQFVYLMQDDEAKLAGYHVSGMALFPSNAPATTTTTNTTDTTTPAAPASPPATPQAPPTTTSST
ncbi:MAG: hypothetical protein ABUS57_03265 [Pseudomonadota bacterium]